MMILHGLFAWYLRSVFCSGGRWALDTDDLEPLEQLMSSSNGIREDEFQSVINRRSYLRMAMIGDDELSLCMQLFQKYLTKRPDLRIVQFPSDEEESVEHDLTLNKRHLRIRHLRTQPGQYNYDAESLLFFVYFPSRV